MTMMPSMESKIEPYLKMLGAHSDIYVEIDHEEDVWHHEEEIWHDNDVNAMIRESSSLFTFSSNLSVLNIFETHVAKKIWVKDISMIKLFHINVQLH